MCRSLFPLPLRTITTIRLLSMSVAFRFSASEIRKPQLYMKVAHILATGLHSTGKSRLASAESSTGGIFLHRPAQRTFSVGQSFCRVLV